MKSLGTLISSASLLRASLVELSNHTANRCGPTRWAMASARRDSWGLPAEMQLTDDLLRPATPRGVKRTATSRPAPVLRGAGAKRTGGRGAADPHRGRAAQSPCAAVGLLPLVEIVLERVVSASFAVARRARHRSGRGGGRSARASGSSAFGGSRDGHSDTTGLLPGCIGNRRVGHHRPRPASLGAASRPDWGPTRRRGADCTGAPGRPQPGRLTKSLSTPAGRPTERKPLPSGGLRLPAGGRFYGTGRGGWGTCRRARASRKDDCCTGRSTARFAFRPPEDTVAKG